MVYWMWILTTALQPAPTPQVSSYTATFAPRPQPSAYSSTPILNQAIQEDEPEVIRYVREQRRKTHSYPAPYLPLHLNLILTRFTDNGAKSKQKRSKQGMRLPKYAVKRPYRKQNKPSTHSTRITRKRKNELFETTSSSTILEILYGLLTPLMSPGIRRLLFCKSLANRFHPGRLGNGSASLLSCKTPKAKP